MSLHDEEDVKAALNVRSFCDLDHAHLVQMFDLLAQMEPALRERMLESVPGLREVALEGVGVVEAIVESGDSAGASADDQLLRDVIINAQTYFGAEATREGASEEHRRIAMDHLADTIRAAKDDRSEQRAHEEATQASRLKAQIITEALRRGVPAAIALARIGLDIAKRRAISP